MKNDEKYSYVFKQSITAPTIDLGLGKKNLGGWGQEKIRVRLEQVTDNVRQTQPIIVVL